jgi:hypothetical protein
VRWPAHWGKPPILINTWRDAVQAAAETAHDLADCVAAPIDAAARIDPSGCGLSHRSRFRIALHAGSVSASC